MSVGLAAVPAACPTPRARTPQAVVAECHAGAARVAHTGRCINRRRDERRYGRARQPEVAVCGGNVAVPPACTTAGNSTRPADSAIRNVFI